MWYLNEKPEQRWAWAKAFEPDHCEKIIQQSLCIPLERGKVISDNPDGLDNTARISNIAWLSSDISGPFAWIYEHCAKVVAAVNKQFFNYELDYLENLQFTVYDSAGSHFSKHVDNLSSANKNRKLSFSVQLSASETYTGGDLLLYNGEKPTYAVREQGYINFFPSWTLHEVTPITSGTRYSLVGWCHGPKFK